MGNIFGQNCVSGSEVIEFANFEQSMAKLR